MNWTSGHNMWNFLGHEKQGIRQLLLADGPHGVRGYEEMEDNHALALQNLAASTMFPIAAAMASTFHPDLIRQVGQAIGKECNQFKVDVLLGPGINLKRSPLGGRNFEYYSEDPVLTTKIGRAFVSGVQEQGVGTCIKHFALNEQESQRRFVNTIADERTLHELYLYPFEEIIKEENPYMVMTSYNKVNGHYAGESSYLLKDILRDKWNYNGAIVSDWGGIQNKTKSLLNGINLEMPGNSEFQAELEEAVKNGHITEEQLDASLDPLLALYDRINENPNRGTKCDTMSHHEIAQEVARHAIVLLENDGILPLKKGLKLGVIGDFADHPRINGGGSATLKPTILEHPLSLLKEEFDVLYAKGYSEEETNEAYLKEVSEVCQKSDVILFFTGTTKSLEEEGKDRPHMNIPSGHLQVYKAIQDSNKKHVTIINSGSAINVSQIKESNALLQAWLLGQANASALVEILLGKVNPSGRLSETFPVSIEQTPLYKSFPSWTDEVNYNGDILSIGYRYYDTHGIKPAYPFGYGLSYSNFTYSNLQVDDTYETNQEVVLKLDISNTSDIDGYDVIQVYVKDTESYYPRPNKELKTFQKVFVKAHETKTVTLSLRPKDFAVYALDHKDFVVEEGYFDILVGTNVSNIVLSKQIYVKSDIRIRTSFTLEHPLKTFFKFKPESVDYLVEKYRDFPWYEIEEPALRVLRRVKREFAISDEEFTKILDRLLA